MDLELDSQDLDLELGSCNITCITKCKIFYSPFSFLCLFFLGKREKRERTITIAVKLDLVPRIKLAPEVKIIVRSNIYVFDVKILLFIFFHGFLFIK